MDLLHAQFNGGRLSIDAIKTVLGNDFASWGALSKKFKVDEDGLYYNERAELEQEKRRKFSESRRKNLSSKRDHTDDHMEIEDENESHSVFALRLLSKEGEGDKEAVEISTRTFVTEELLKQFNANLKNSNAKHFHFSEYKKHLVNWIPKKPKNNEQRTKPTQQQNPKFGRINATTVSSFLTRRQGKQGSEVDTDSEAA